MDGRDYTWFYFYMKGCRQAMSAERKNQGLCFFKNEFPVMSSTPKLKVLNTYKQRQYQMTQEFIHVCAYVCCNHNQKCHKFERVGGIRRDIGRARNYVNTALIYEIHLKSQCFKKKMR